MGFRAKQVIFLSALENSVNGVDISIGAFSVMEREIRVIKEPARTWICLSLIFGRVGYNVERK